VGSDSTSTTFAGAIIVCDRFVKVGMLSYRSAKDWLFPNAADGTGQRAAEVVEGKK
jgi:hypothetical protein